LISTALSGHDPKDSTSLQIKKVDYTQNLDGRLPKNLTIGIIKEAVESEGMHPDVRIAFKNAIEQLQKLGAKIKYIDIPHLKYGIAVYFILSRAEAASNLARYDGTLYGKRTADAQNLHEMYIKTRQEGFGMEVKRRILTGNYVLSAGHVDAYYNKANQVRGMIRAEFQQAFNDVNLLISPTTSTVPFKIGEFANDPVAMYLVDYYNNPNCVIGTPGLSIPCGFSKDKLPIGMQFLGPRLSEELIYKVAYAFEQSTDHHTKVPVGYE
jgi:aspartyl-tRNA(Asn)/glutamyl-tRNA(Gln) amidotransferase subunit A